MKLLNLFATASTPRDTMLTAWTDANQANYEAEVEAEAVRAMEEANQPLAVEHANGILSKTLAALENERDTLENEIRERMEKLRQVQVTLKALGTANEILIEDMNRGQDDRIPQVSQVAAA